MATTGQIWGIMIVAVIATAFLVSAAHIAYRSQNRYHRRLRAAGLLDTAMTPTQDTTPRPEYDAPGIVSTAAGRMGPEGDQLPDTLAARAAWAPQDESVSGTARVPAQRTGRRGVPARTDEELAAQAELPTRDDLPPAPRAQPGTPAQRGAPQTEQAQRTHRRRGLWR